VKRFIKVLFTTLLVLSLAFSFIACGGAEGDGDNEVKGIKYKKYAKDLYTIYGYVQEDGKTELDLDAEIKLAVGEEAEVGKIATGAFSGNDALTKIIVPDTVVEISAGAFKNMNKLEELVLPFIGKTANSDLFFDEPNTDGENEGVEKSVDVERTFAYIFGTDSYEKGSPITVNYGAGEATYYIPAYFKKVTISTSKTYSVPMYAFSGIALVREVVLCNTIDAIGEGAFSSCHDLVSVSIPSSVTAIYKEAFKDSANFGKNLDIDGKSTVKDFIDRVANGADIYAGTYLAD
jgi:hypothetical protein